MALDTLISKVFSRTDRQVLNQTMLQADHLAPEEIQARVDAANKAGKVDLAFLLGSLKYAKEIWNNVAFWDHLAPDAKESQVLLGKANAATMPADWSRYDRYGSTVGARAKFRAPDGKVSQQELLRGIVQDRAKQLGVKQLRFSTLWHKAGL